MSPQAITDFLNLAIFAAACFLIALLCVGGMIFAIWRKLK